MDHDHANTTSLREEAEPFSPYESIHFAPLQFVNKYLQPVAIVFISVLIIANNSILIAVICKNKILQTRTNYIILNFAVVILILIIDMTLDSILAALGYYLGDLTVSIILKILFSSLMQISFALVALLGTDWYISANLKNFCSRYQKGYKWAIAACYGVPLLCNSSMFVAGYHWLNIIWSDFITYWICAFIIIVINVIKCSKTYSQEILKSSYTLAMSNIYFLIWLPLEITTIIYFILSQSESLSSSDAAIVAIIYRCLRLVALLAPVVIVFMLIRRDNNFKRSYDVMFKRSGNAYTQEYNRTENENLC